MIFFPKINSVRNTVRVPNSLEPNPAQNFILREHHHDQQPHQQQWQLHLPIGVSTFLFNSEKKKGNEIKVSVSTLVLGAH